MADGRHYVKFINGHIEQHRIVRFMRIIRDDAESDINDGRMTRIERFLKFNMADGDYIGKNYSHISVKRHHCKI